MTKIHTRLAKRLLLLTLATLAILATTSVTDMSYTPAAEASNLVWSASHESGSMSEWTASGGGIFNSGNGVVSASTDFARAGKYSAKMTIQTGDGNGHAVRLFRWAESRANADAYYSVWYYFPQTFSGMSWWNVMQWKSKTSSSNDPIITVNIGNRNGSMYFYLYDHLANTNRGSSAANIPVGKWVHFEAFYKQASDSTGRVTVWQDGVQILDANGIKTRRSGDEVHWSVNNYTDRISPSTATIYADDAAISLSRVWTSATSPTPTLAPTQAPTAPTPTPAPSTPTPAPAPSSGGNYYVDSVAGSDSNSGTSESSPWKTLSGVQSRTFQPGDTINFKRGSSWSGGLTIKSSGVSGKPITFKAYGTGNRPVITNPGVSWGAAIRVQASYVVVRDFMLRDAHEAGVAIDAGANYNVVQENEITATGTGVMLKGQYNLATRNYAHNLTMVRNTSGGDDDWGAVGIWVQASNNDVTHNRIVNARAQSYDYGYDGGAVEIYGHVSNVRIIGNYSQGSRGFLEVGGGSARNILLAHNVSNNDYIAFTMMHLTGTFGSVIENFRVENNTILRNTKEWRVLDFKGDPSPSTYSFRNNVVYTTMNVANSSAFTHTNNVYHLLDGAGLGFSLGSAERLADPLFANRTGGDFRLQWNSPAIDTGMNLGHSKDFDGNPVPSGAAPDMGAFEFVGTAIAPTPAPTATPTPSPSPTATPTTSPTIQPTPTAILEPAPTATATPAPTSEPISGNGKATAPGQAKKK